MVAGMSGGWSVAMRWLAVPLVLCSAHCAAPKALPVVAASQPSVVVTLTTRLAERVIVLGESVDGRALELLVFGDEGVESATLIIAGIHGNEPTSTAVGRALV